MLAAQTERQLSCASDVASGWPVTTVHLLYTLGSQLLCHTVKVRLIRVRKVAEPSVSGRLVVDAIPDGRVGGSTCD